MRAALDAGAELRSLVPHRVSLESIFLSAVEQGAREERVAPAAADAGERGAR